VRLVDQLPQQADFSLDGISGYTFENAHLIDTTGDDWALWSCAWSWVKVEDVSDVVDGGCDGSDGSWFCTGGRTGGRAESQGRMLDGCKEYQ